MNFYRGELAKEHEVRVPLNSRNVTILNLGPGDIFVNFDAPAQGSLLIPGCTGRSLNLEYLIEYIHIYSTDTTQIQIDGMG